MKSPEDQPRRAGRSPGPLRSGVPTRLFRYALKEVLGPTLVAFGAYTGFMLIRGLIQFSDLLLQSDNPLGDTARVLAFSLPHIVVLTLPVAFLLGILVAVGRMSADSEIIALRAAGLDVARLYRPIGFLAALLFAATLVLMVEVVPRTNRILYDMKLNLSTFAIAQRIQPGVFSPEVGGISIYVESASPDHRTLNGLIVSDRSDPDEGERLTFARQGFLEIEPEDGRLWLRLEGAVTHHVPRDPSRYDLASFATHRLVLVDAKPEGPGGRGEKQLREETLSELRARAASPRRTAVDRRLALLEIQKKLALPAACLVFGLLGLPLGVVTRRGGRAAGFTVSVAIVLAYYVLFATGEARAIEGRWTPFFAMWLPNILLAALGLAALHRVRRDRGILPSGAVLALLPRRSPAQERTPLRAAEPVPERRRPGRLSPLLIDRYVTSRFARFFVLVVLSILVLYVLIDYLEIADDIAKNRPALRIVFAYYEALLSPILLDVVPFAFLVAALVTTAGLVRSSETTALLAHGVSLYRAVAALLLLASLTGGALFLFAERIVPRAALEAERQRRIILKHPQLPPIGSGRVWVRGRDGRFFASDAMDPKTGALAHVSVLEVDPVTFRLRSRTEASRGQLVPQGILAEDGWVRTFGSADQSLFLRRPGRFLVDAPEASEVLVAGRADPRQMTTAELIRFIAARRAAGADVSALATGLHQKIAGGFSTVLLTLVGLPFAFRFGRRGAVAGIGVALLLGLSYLFATSLLTRLGEAGALPPFLAAWGANVFYGLGAAWELLGVRT